MANNPKPKVTLKKSSQTKTESGKAYPRSRRSVKKKKTLNPLPLIFVSILAVAAYFGYGPVMKAIAEANPPEEVKVVKKPEIKKKKVIKKEIPKKVIKKIIPKFVAPKEEYFKGEVKHYTFSSIVEQHCFSCHGEEGKEIEGKFNFIQFLTKNTENPKAWKIIYDEIASGSMPPEEEQPLTPEEKEILLAEIKKMTAGHDINRRTRLLTPNEIVNTISDLFQVDDSVYNPFSKLYQNYSNETYYTCQDNRLTPFYLDDLFTVLNDVIDSYVSLDAQLKPLQQKVLFPASSGQSHTYGSTTYLQFNSTGLYSKIKFARIRTKREINEESRKQKFMTKEQIAQQKDIEENTLPPGTYKLSFDAQSFHLDPNYYSFKDLGPKVINLYKNLLQGYDYSLPVNFMAVPPGKSDAYAKENHLTTLDISSSETSRYTVKFTLSRRSAIAYNFALPDLSMNGIATMIARHHEPESEGDNRLMSKYRAKYLLHPKVKTAHVRFNNLKIEGPFDVKVNNYSIDKNDRVNDLTVRKKFRNLHDDANMQNNTVYSYIFSKLKQSKLDEHESYRTAIAAFFMSTDFLTLKNNKKDKLNYPRFISYAFHKSHPSKEFLEVFKKAQTTKNPDILTTWLVNHKNFKRFLKAFSYQWLNLENILSNSPVENRFGAYHKNSFFKAYQIEASQFLQYLYTNNLPVKELVTANYSFVNEDLTDVIYNSGNARASLVQGWKAKELTENNFKKTDFTDPNRGGLLAMGGFLTATGNGVDGLPLKRANWILENLLDSKLPPPPPEIDIEAFESGEHGHNLKKKLESHTKDPACYSCHKRMDPIAIMMDKFNTIGADNYDYSHETVMINDQKIRSVADLKTYIGSQDHILARAFTKNILEFTLGRQLYVQDEPKLNDIITENAKGNFKVKDLLNSIIKYYFL